jgi:hypothetical protein
MQGVTQAGGEVLGQYVAFHDTEGNRNSMMQPLAMG